jgi:peroxiredoxin
MHALGIIWLVVSSLNGPATFSATDPSIGSLIRDFELRDDHGNHRKLSDWADRKLLVVVFIGVDCPLAKLYAPRVAELNRTFEHRGAAFVSIDSQRQDRPDAISRFAESHHIDFPILLDPEQKIAVRFGARRTPEAFILDENRIIRYRGRIDDQYTVTGRRQQPSRCDLAVALEELLRGEPISTPVTETTGCLIERSGSVESKATVTYSREIAPILQKHCVGCHRPGQIAPFALTNYRQAANRAETIAEVVRVQRMPPWHADAKFGRFANDARLMDEEKQLIEEWVNAGHPEGNRAALPPPIHYPESWTIPGPDQVVSMPKPFTVPAEGAVEYQVFKVDPGFHEDKWIRAAEIRPGNRKVVHHCNVYLQPPDSDEPVEQGTLGSFCLAAMAPGTPALMLPEGMAKLVPAGWHFVFVVHYTPIGSLQTDQTSIGLMFADPKSVQKEVATKVLLDEDLRIPPGVADHRVEKSHQFKDNVLIFAFFPHMHLRGKSFRYEVTYPDCSREILLDVPRYDFQWQNRYVLAEPKHLPAGTKLYCIAHYDNSTNNPFNPDPNATVRTGLQSWDEMFNGYFEWALADQDLTKPVSWQSQSVHIRSTILRPAAMLISLACCGALLWVQRRRRTS